MVISQIMTEQDLLYRIAFASVRGMGYDLAHKILDIIPSEKDFFSISQKELEQIFGSRTKITSQAYRLNILEQAKKETEFVIKNKIGVTYFNDIDYPTRLANAPDSPILFFSKGNCNLSSRHIVSIVGTRHATPYGINFTKNIVEELASMLPDLVIVSGLAYGIDIAAHLASLQNKISTVAVLAHGLNTIYPSQHRKAAIDIIHNNGMLITDYSSQTLMHRANFIARNRIIAGLSDCTIVSESASKGGSLITASIANSYNRDVFALPGRSSDEYSKGCNKLIQNNAATLVLCAEDVIKHMQWDKDINKQPKQAELFPILSENEQLIYDTIAKNGEIHINTLTNLLKIPIYKVLSDIVELEFKGLILSLPGSRYMKA